MQRIMCYTLYIMHYMLCVARCTLDNAQRTILEIDIYEILLYTMSMRLDKGKC